ncbi:hypothetical protein Tco_1202796 [Tanacetum coccineum]
MGTNVKQCLRKVSNGYFTAAVKVLCSLGVAPFGTDTLTALLAKHLILPPPVMPGLLPSEPPLVVDVDSGSAIIVGLLKAISVVVNLLLEGRCPKVLTELVAYAPLTPLLKRDNKIKHIAVGAIWRRLASKVAMRGVRKEMSKYVGDFQFGVGVPSGAEAVLYGANKFLNKLHSDGSLAMLTVDFSNAFNLVERTTLLHEVVKAIDIIRAEGPRLGLKLNINKTEVFWPSCNRVKVKDGLFPRDIGRPMLGVKLLGGASTGPSIRAPFALLMHGCRKAVVWSQNVPTYGCGIDGADSDYGYALDHVRMFLLEFDLSGFSTKDTPQKARMFWRVPY